jgi:transcriptional regulator with GAF, ATPase, and Fis domain
MLRDNSGIMSGEQRGAAARLGQKRTTLQYRLGKLRIEHKRMCVVATS